MSAHLELGRLADRFAHLEKFEILTSHVQRLLAEWDELVDLYEEAITNDEEWGPPVQDTVDIGTYYDDAGAEGTLRK